MLKQLRLKKKIELIRAQITAHDTRLAEIQAREEELELAIGEAENDDDLSLVDEEIATVTAEKDELTEKKSALSAEIEQLERELEELNAVPEPAEPATRNKEDKGAKTIMINRNKFFAGMERSRVDAIMAAPETKAFAERVRSFIAEKRAVSGAELNIPDNMLGLLRDSIASASKLISKVTYKPVKGTARQNVTGSIPEAVWTEMVGALNELELTFNQVEVDGYKVGGFVPVPNSYIKDSDEDLVAEVLTILSKSMALALDKSIIFGTGTKQPLGIATRLAQTSEPSSYPANAPAWKDLHTTNITKVSTTGAALIGSIIIALAACKNDHSDGNKFFAMNSVTYAYLMSQLLNFNAVGALVTGASGQMPVIGGDIVVLDFISNYDIIGGYGDLYLLAEREGFTLGSSDHVKFLEDMTVFKGIGRYDGLPVIAEGFFIINVNNASATTTKTFPVDYANTEIGALGVTSVAGTLSGDTLITVTGTEVSGTTLAYKVAGKVTAVANGQIVTGFTAFESADDITAATGKIITVVELNAEGRAIKVGSAQVVAKA